MAQLIRRLALRLWRALTTLPDARGWGISAAIGVVTLALMGAIGFATGGYVLGPARTDGLAMRLLTVWILPALGEEAPFRGLLMPSRAAAPSPWRGLAISTPLYVAWHVVEALTFLPAARGVLLRPDFLACTTVLGLGCGLVRWRTGSLWPAVLLHGTMVTIWQTWLGGFVL